MCWIFGLLGILIWCSSRGFGSCVTIFLPMMLSYIVLAETLGAALVTRDGRLASASGHAALIELF